MTNACMRLTAAGQVLQPNDSCRRNLPFIILLSISPLQLQQRQVHRDGSREVPSLSLTCSCPLGSSSSQASL